MSETLVIRRSHAAVQQEVAAYSSLFEDSTNVEKRQDQYKTLVSNYYSLSTDFFEYGWGQSFHFANRFRGETLAESIQRHESYLALKMQVKPGDKVLDLGCGVGGPLRRIANLTGAHITGVTISEYQIQRAKQIGKHLFIFNHSGNRLISYDLGVPANCRFIQCDFMQLPFEDASFDHIYTIEAVCHAPDKVISMSSVRVVIYRVFLGEMFC